MKKFVNFLNRWRGIFRLLAVIFAFVLVFGIVVGNLLEVNSAQVNRVLGTSTSTVVGGDYDLYTPDYDTSDELKDRHIELGTQVGAEGSVLLQNDNDALPLDASNEKITLFGYASAQSGTFYGMAMGGEIETSQSVSLYDALTGKGASVNADMNDYYENNLSKNKNILNVSLGTVSSATKYSFYEIQPNLSLMESYTDVGIVVIGRPSTEGGDYYPGAGGISKVQSYNPETGNTEENGKAGRNSLALTSDELDLIDTAKSTCEKVIVLVNSANPMELGPIMTDGDHEVDSILWIGLPGNYGYYGIADVLLGNTSPSGHLTDTYAMDSTSAPAMQNFGLYKFSNIEATDEDDRNQYYLVEAEGIYTGYKYYETRYEDAVIGQGNASSSAGAFEPIEGQSVDSWKYDEQVAFSFGYGMSYTTFDQTITDVKFSDDMRTATVNVTVENTGDVAGRSVVQVYGQSPYTEYDEKNDVEKASVQLLNYGKTQELAANGGSEDISIDIDMQLLASYDTDGEGTYIMEASEDYYFSLGCNSDSEGSHAAVNNVLAAKGYTKEKSDVLDSNGDADATYKFTWNESDEDLFSISKEGVEIANQFDDADLNNLDCGTTVTYLSRSDWEWKNSSGVSMWNTGTWADTSSKGYTDVAATASMQRILENDLYEVETGDVSDILFDQENGHVFSDMISLDEDGNIVVADYDNPLWDELLEELNLEEAIGFIMAGNSEYSALDSIGFAGGYFTENGPTGLQKKMSSGYEAPWYDSNDSNGEYAWNDMGAAPLQAATFDQELLKEIGKMWGNDSLYVNLPMLWAPALNLHRTPYNGRTAEYYSEDSTLTGYSAMNVSNGAEEKGFIVTIKHFAFNDQESNRCGIAVFQNEQKARENELRGFQIALEGGVKAVMTSFNRVGCMFSSADEGLMGVLRDEWNFKGYVVTDLVYSYDYVTFADAVIAGTSTFDSTYDKAVSGWGSPSEMAEKYKNDPTMLQAIKDSVHATLWTFAHTNYANYAGGTGKWVANWWRVTYITLEVAGGILAGASLVFYVLALVFKKKKNLDDAKDTKESNGLQEE